MHTNTKFSHHGVYPMALSWQKPATYNTYLLTFCLRAVFLCRAILAQNTFFGTKHAAAGRPGRPQCFAVVTRRRGATQDSQAWVVI